MAGEGSMAEMSAEQVGKDLEEARGALRAFTAEHQASPDPASPRDPAILPALDSGILRTIQDWSLGGAERRNGALQPHEHVGRIPCPVR